MNSNWRTYLTMNYKINLPGYLERTSVLDFVGAALPRLSLSKASRDRFNARLNLRQAQMSKPLWGAK